METPMTAHCLRIKKAMYSIRSINIIIVNKKFVFFEYSFERPSAFLELNSFDLQFAFKNNFADPDTSPPPV